MLEIINLVYAFIIGIAHYLSDSFTNRKTYQKEIRSFAAGLSIAYLLLYLFPELYIGVVEFHRSLFLFVLLGSMVFHLIEKYIYQHERRNIRIFELRVMHAAAFFIYHIIIGIILVSINQINPISGILFFIPILFYTLVSQVSLSNLHANVTEKLSLKLLLSSSTLIGVLIASFFTISTKLHFSLLAFIAGALLYNVMVEVVPKETDGNILFFMLGTLAYITLIFSMGGF
jgi:hypothetical protein